MSSFIGTSNVHLARSYLGEKTGICRAEEADLLLQTEKKEKSIVSISPMARARTIFSLHNNDIYDVGPDDVADSLVTKDSVGKGFNQTSGKEGRCGFFSLFYLKNDAVSILSFSAFCPRSNMLQCQLLKTDTSTHAHMLCPHTLHILIMYLGHPRNNRA